MDKINYYKQASNKNKKSKYIDWIALKNEYITTNISIQKLANKHKISYHALKDRAYNGKWKQEKNKRLEEIEKRTVEKSIDLIAEKKSKALENHFKISEYLLYKIGNSLKNEKEFNIFVEKVKTGLSKEELKEFTFDSLNDKKLLNVVNSFEKIQKLQRQTLGIQDLKDEISAEQRQKQLDHNIETDKKKLELEEKRIEKDINPDLKPVVFDDSKDRYEEWKKQNDKSD